MNFDPAALFRLPDPKELGERIDGIIADLKVFDIGLRTDVEGRLSRHEPGAYEDREELTNTGVDIGFIAASIAMVLYGDAYGRVGRIRGQCHRPDLIDRLFTLLVSHLDNLKTAFTVTTAMLAEYEALSLYSRLNPAVRGTFLEVREDERALKILIARLDYAIACVQAEGDGKPLPLLPKKT